MKTGITGRKYRPRGSGHGKKLSIRIYPETEQAVDILRLHEPEWEYSQGINRLIREAAARVLSPDARE